MFYAKTNKSNIYRYTPTRGIALKIQAHPLHTYTLWIIQDASEEQ